MKFDRRTLLRSIAGAAAATALDPLVPRLSAQTSDPKRFVYWYTPVMPPAEIVDPMYQAQPGPLAFLGAFAPLNGIASKLSFVRNLENAAKDDCEGGDDGPHPKGGTSYLLGRGWGAGLGGDPLNGQASAGPHSSLDQYLAQQLEKRGESTFISDLRLGLKNEGKNGNCDKSISIRDGRVRLRHQNARDALAELMPLTGNPASGSDPNAIRRRSVLDVTRGALTRLQARLGSEDRARIDAHLEAVRSLERRIEQAENAGNCNHTIDTNVPNLEREDVAQDLSIEVIKLALSCGATRVAGAQWGPNTSNLTFDFLPDKRKGGSNWHQSTHEAGNEAYHRGVLNFQAKQFRKLVETLEDVVEPSGKTLLDNTVVIWYTDVPRDHSSDDAFCLLAGGTHYFRHGNMVNASGPHNRALTSIMHAMDVDGDTFGDTKYGTGELPSSMLK